MQFLFILLAFLGSTLVDDWSPGAVIQSKQEIVIKEFEKQRVVKVYDDLYFAVVLDKPSKKRRVIKTNANFIVINGWTRLENEKNVIGMKRYWKKVNYR